MESKLTLDFGRDATESEIEAVKAAFEPHFRVEDRAEVIRLSHEILPLIILFTVSAVADGLYWDSIKAAIGAVFNAYRSGQIKRKPVFKIRSQTREWVISPDKVVESTTEEEAKINSLDEYIDYMKFKNKNK